MAALVVDASLSTAWCFPDENADYANLVLRKLSTPIIAIAPRLWAYEIRNSVLMGIRRKRVTQDDAEEFLRSLANLPIRLADPDSYDRLLNLANQSSLTVYDAAYLDLAMREALPLASLDKALCKAATKAGVSLFEP